MIFISSLSCIVDNIFPSHKSHLKSIQESRWEDASTAKFKLSEFPEFDTLSADRKPPLPSKRRSFGSCDDEGNFSPQNESDRIKLEMFF